MYLCPGFERYKEQNRCFDAIFCSRDAGIIHTMTALIKVKWRLTRLPTRIPYRSIIVDIEIPAAIIHRHTIIAVASDAAELGILIEVITSGRIGNQAEKVLVAEVIDPRERRGWISDDVLAFCVVIMSISFHVINGILIIHLSDGIWSRVITLGFVMASCHQAVLACS